jgi:hypothetical protein
MLEVARPLLAAIYFGDWHVDPQMSAVHGASWTEWELPLRATPRFPGHVQPNLPLSDAAHGFGVSEAENTPSVMEKKIDVAVDHGVGMFLFDWCHADAVSHLSAQAHPTSRPFLAFTHATFCPWANPTAAP